jgi:hypothetical protein
LNDAGDSNSENDLALLENERRQQERRDKEVNGAWVWISYFKVEQDPKVKEEKARCVLCIKTLLSHLPPGMGMARVYIRVKSMISIQ